MQPKVAAGLQRDHCQCSLLIVSKTSSLEWSCNAVTYVLGFPYAVYVFYTTP